MDPPRPGRAPLLGVVPVLLGLESSGQWTALLVTVVEFVLSLGLWWAFDPSRGTLQLVSNAPWIPDWGIAYRVGIDGISLVMVLLTTLLMPISVLGSWQYITKQERGFYALMLTLLDGPRRRVHRPRPLRLLRLLRGHADPDVLHHRDLGRRQPALRGDQVLHLHDGGLAADAGGDRGAGLAVRAVTGYLTFSYDHLLQHAGCRRARAPWLFAAFAIAFAIKVPVFPFHTWLPDAHVEAPTAGSVLLAAVMLKMGTYGFLRFAVPFFPEVALSPTVSASSWCWR